MKKFNRATKVRRMEYITRLSNDIYESTSTTTSLRATSRIDTYAKIDILSAAIIEAL